MTVTEAIRFYVANAGRDYYDTEDEAIAACRVEIGEYVVRETRSGREVGRQRIYPTLGSLYSEFP